jgi:hypothetical protein
MDTLPGARRTIPMASASSAIAAVSTPCGNVNIGRPRIRTGGHAGVKEVEDRLHLSRHCYRSPVLERGVKPIGDCQSELTLASRSGSGSLRRPVVDGLTI